mmetsp:Transcript_47976/g.154799  ORF Transcript_47976/g.154799 Transcript_47976/m.154799 type:complete len:305 (-) Transcript_47976:137-1051(-)
MGKKDVLKGELPTEPVKPKKKKDVLKGELPTEPVKPKKHKKRAEELDTADDDAAQEASSVTKKQRREREVAEAEPPAKTKKSKVEQEAQAVTSAKAGAGGDVKKTAGAKKPGFARDSKADRPDVFRSDLRVFVSNIPKKVDEETLKKDFEECGEVANIKLLKEGHTDESRGMAFITFKDEAGFNGALAFEGDDYGGNTLRVRKAEAKGITPKHDPGAKPEGCNSIVIKQLAPEVVEDDLWELFKSCGSGPTHVGLLTDKATGKSRCTARVDFEDTAAVDLAFKLAGSEVKGQSFTLNYCAPRSW